MSTPTWNPLPPITGPPIGSDTLAKSINDKMQLTVKGVSV